MPRHTKWLNLLALLVGVGFVVAMWSKIGWAVVAQDLRTVGWAFLLIVGIHFCASCAETAALRRTTSRDLPFLRVLGAQLAGASVNAYSPLREAGEVIKWNLLAARAQGAETASGVLVWNVLFHVSKFAAIFLAPLPLLVMHPGLIPADKIALVEIAGFLAFVPSLVLCLAVWRGSAEIVVRLLHRLPILRSRQPEAWIERARQTDARVRAFACERRRDAIAAINWFIVARLLTAFELQVALWSLGATSDFSTAFFLHAGTLVVALYVSISPVQIGVSEAGQYVLFGLVGLSPALGFSQALVRRICYLLFHAAGFAYLGYESFHAPKSPAESNRIKSASCR